jgi:hypothetical protein
MKTRIKGKELLKVVAMCVLSIGLFGAAFVGFNQLIFAAATNEAVPLPTHAEIFAPAPVSELRQLESGIGRVQEENLPQNSAHTEIEAEIFTAPDLTLIYQNNHPVPASALSMEEAAQIGARYIWDVFGTSIDGMYVRMFYAAHSSHSRTYWHGIVHAERFDGFDIENDDIAARIAFNDAILYNFSIDAITGMRVDISTGFRFTVSQDELINRSTEERFAVIEARWWELNLAEQLTFLGISIADIAEYIETARFLADAHFATEGLMGELSTLRIQLGENGLELAAIEYVLTHENREAVISVATSVAHAIRYGIQTIHNDFIPGFEFHYDGISHG